MNPATHYTATVVHHCIMNKIGVIKGKSEYSLNDHLIITVDGRPLEHFISHFDNGGRHGYKGLARSGQAALNERQRSHANVGTQCAPGT